MNECQRSSFLLLLDGCFTCSLGSRSANVKPSSWLCQAQGGPGCPVIGVAFSFPAAFLPHGREEQQNGGGDAVAAKRKGGRQQQRRLFCVSARADNSRRSTGIEGKTVGCRQRQQQGRTSCTRTGLTGTGARKFASAASEPLWPCGGRFLVGPGEIPSLGSAFFLYYYAPR
jgi:hypothetical protein